MEPDSIAFGSTIVDRVPVRAHFVGGGASGIGWATSTDAGSTWRRGFLERVGERVSDPVVAYDRLHGVWLVATLGSGRPRTRRRCSSAGRADGLVWSRPAPAAADPAEDYDKEWIACDTWTSSRFPVGAISSTSTLPERRDPRLAARPTVDARGRAPVAAPVASQDSPRERRVPRHPPRRRAARLLQRLRLDRPGRRLDPGGPVAGRRRDDSSRRGGSLPCSPRTSSGCAHRPSCRPTSMPRGTVYVTWADCRFSAAVHRQRHRPRRPRGTASTGRQPRLVPFGSPESRARSLHPRPRRRPRHGRARARIAIVAYSVTQAQGCRTARSSRRSSSVERRRPRRGAPPPAPQRRIDAARMGRRDGSRPHARGLHLRVVRRRAADAGALARGRAGGGRAPPGDLRDDTCTLTRLPSNA